MDPLVLEVKDDITKPPHDGREYRYLQLHNQMKVLLVSDPTTEKAAASMVVRVGHISDPEDIPGLAHFCEHMLFLGTEKYPSENEYTEFLSHHGGSSNACTSCEFTKYFFDVVSEHLTGALDRFAQFFISPLFNADARDREVQAVDSENENNLQMDPWRFRQVCKHTCREGHPYRKFGSGNRYTLETHPRELGKDVREELLKFHSTHYSSNLMCLSVLGKETLSELTALVTELFSPVLNRQVSVPVFPEHPLSDKELQVWIEYVPVKELRQLTLEFPIPDISEYYSCDPSVYVAHLIGHEGPGSLLSYLKARGWCNQLVAGPSPGAKGFMFFSVTVDMTEEGEDHIEQIVTAFFQYVSMMRREGLQEWIYKEIADVNVIGFRFMDKQKPRSYAQILAASLHEYAPHEVLSGPHLLSDFRPDLTAELVLDKIKPQYLRIGVVSQKFQGQATLTEPWYGSEYNIRKIDSKLIEFWSAVEPIEDFHLPTPNEFIPTNFDILPLRENPPPKVPTLIQDTPMSKVWYKQDDTFFAPKACICVKISTPVAYQDPVSANLTQLFVALLLDDLNEYAYNAEIAGIMYDIRRTVYGINIEVSGYSHKQSTLLTKIMSKMTQFSVDFKRFEIHKELLSRKLRNFKAEQPYIHAIYYNSLVLDNKCWTKEELAEAIEEVTAEQLQSFIPTLFSQVHVEALVHGNISRQGCLDIVGIVEDCLRSGFNLTPLSSPMSTHRQIQLPDRSSFKYCGRNEVHNSSSVFVYLQTGPESISSNMLLELLAQVVREPCFDTLRTKEQLGYIVTSSRHRMNGVGGLAMLIQSEKDVSHVEARMEVFLQRTKELLMSMKVEELERHKQSLAVKLLEKPKKVREETSKHWSEITSQQYHFNRVEEEVPHLKDITLEMLLDYFQEFIACEAPLRHKLAVHVVPSQSPNGVIPPVSDGGGQMLQDNDDVTDGGVEEVDTPSLLSEAPTEIKDISSFKIGMPVYPPVRPYICTSL